MDRQYNFQRDYNNQLYDQFDKPGQGATYEADYYVESEQPRVNRKRTRRPLISSLYGEDYVDDDMLEETYQAGPNYTANPYNLPTNNNLPYERESYFEDNYERQPNYAQYAKTTQYDENLRYAEDTRYAEQTRYAEEPRYTEEPRYVEVKNYKQAPIRPKKRRSRVGVFSLLGLIALSMLFLLIYRRMMPKRTTTKNSFSLFDHQRGKNKPAASNLPNAAKKTKTNNSVPNTSKVAETFNAAKKTKTNNSVPNISKVAETLDNSEVQQAPQQAASIGGSENFQGAINLSDEQISRMLNLNLQPEEENVRHNLAILGENDKRVAELIDAEEEGKLAPSMLRLAAKNEAFDFVYKYLQLPANSELKQATATSKTGASSLGNYKLPAGKVLQAPYYKQWDERWGYKPYAGSVIGTYGCGVTCMASVLGYLTNDATILPDKLALLSNESNMNHGGTDTSFILLAAAKYGFQAVGIPVLANNFKAAIDNNNAIVLNVGQGNFTAGGHYIAIIGYTDEGNFIIYDPVSPYHTSQVWPIELLQKQNAKACWAIGK